MRHYARRVAVERVVYLVIAPTIVPPTAFELPSVTVLDPAHFASPTIDDLILKLCAAPRPERLGRRRRRSACPRSRRERSRPATARRHGETRRNGDAARNVKIMDARSSSR